MYRLILTNRWLTLAWAASFLVSVALFVDRDGDSQKAIAKAERTIRHGTPVPAKPATIRADDEPDSDWPVVPDQPDAQRQAPAGEPVDAQAPAGPVLSLDQEPAPPEAQ